MAAAASSSAQSASLAAALASIWSARLSILAWRSSILAAASVFIWAHLLRASSAAALASWRASLAARSTSTLAWSMRWRSWSRDSDTAAWAEVLASAARCWRSSSWVEKSMGPPWCGRVWDLAAGRHAVMPDGTALARSCHWAPVTKKPSGVVPSAQPPHDLPAASSAAYHPAVERAGPTDAQHAADVSGALAPHTAELSADIYELIVREIPQLRADSRVLTLLQASVAENVATVLHILQHGIDLDRVHAPAAAEEYARRLAQRGSPMAALLRAYRIGSTRFQHWCLQELGRTTDDASIVSAAGLRIAETTAAYIDRISEELVAAYEAEKENWLRNLSAARAARVRGILQGDRIDVDASEAVLGYRLRQHHVGAVCWLGDREAGGPALARLEHATMEVAARAGCEGRPIFVPQDESSAWAWLPLGASDSFAVPTMRGA